MEFNANSSFYKFNEQWGWFGWSDGPFLGDSTYYQENLKDKHKSSSSNPEILTPYYNIGFNGVQPYIDPMAAAKDSDKGYLLYGDFNAKNYLRRFSLHVKSLNYAQWEHDPQEGRDIAKLSDVDSYNTIGTNNRSITNNGGGRDGTLLDGGTRELTLLDLNTQDLYYKEGSSQNGDKLEDWDNPDINTWDPWPQLDRTYGFGQYGGQDIGEGHYKRYASPVKGAPARIRRIPIYQRFIQYPDSKSHGEGDHIFADQSSSDYPVWISDSCGNISIPQSSKDYYNDTYDINLNEHILSKLIESAGGSSACGKCESNKPIISYKTGYYYTLSTAPVMAKGITGTLSENGLGWDPGPGVTENWAPSGGYGIIVEKLDCNSCPPMIQDVVTKGYDGDTTSQGSGPCKTLELDMGLYEVRGNIQSDILYQELEEGSHSPVIDTIDSNLWIGPAPDTGDCTFFEKGLRSGDCDILTNASYSTGTWTHSQDIGSFINLYKLAESGYQASCELKNKDQYYKTSPSSAIQKINEEGAVQLNLRRLTGIGGIEVYKGEDLFTGDCEARNYLYISGSVSGSALNITGTGCTSTYQIGDTIFISGECAPSITGTGCTTTYQIGDTIFVSGECAPSITGTGCTSTYQIGDTIFISGECAPSITGAGCTTTYQIGDTIFVSGECAPSITGTGCTTTYQIGDTIFVSGECAPSITGTGCTTTYQIGDTIFVSGECAPSITGTGCTTTYQIGDTIFVSGDCTTEVYVTGTGCASTFRQNIDGQEYIFVSGECAPSITGTGCTTTYQIGDTIFVSGECAPSITGTGCTTTYQIGDTIFVSGDCTTEIYVTGTGCASTFRQNIDGQEYIFVSGECAPSITGIGCISTQVVGDTIEISENIEITGESIAGGDGDIFKEIVQTDDCSYDFKFKNIIGQNDITVWQNNSTVFIDYLGPSPTTVNVTGTGCCIETFKIGDTFYVSGTCPTLSGNFPSQTETGTTSFDSSNLIKDYYSITGEDGISTCSNFLEFYSITGTGCIDTFIEDNKIYISGGKGVTGASSANLDNVANVYSGIRTGECGDELVFRQLSGLNCINVDDFGDHIEIYASMSWTAGSDSNLWVGDGIYTHGDETANTQNGCDFTWHLKSITGTGCVETFEQDDTIYISGQNCFPEGGSSCDVLVGPSNNPSWKDSESLILECLGVSWKTITMCEEDGSTSCYDILVRPCSASTTTPSP
jgi:hypothetical protein